MCVLNNRPLTIYGDGSQTRDFVYIDDICRAIILTMENDNAVGIFQIGTGKETTIIELAHKIKTISTNNVDIIFELERAGEIIRNYSGIERARLLLGFVPQMDLDMGLEMTLRWFSQNVYSK